MNLDGILSRARSKAERLMVDTCTIRRPGSVVTDPVSGVVSPTYETVYQGKCKVQTFTNRELLHTGGDYQFIIQRYEVQIPVSVVGVKVNDQAVITASVHDPDLAGRTYRVVGLMDKSEGSARRLGVEEMA